MNGSNLYVSTAVGTNIKSRPLFMETEKPPKISSDEAERIIEKQRQLVADGARANMHEVGRRAMADSHFKSVQRNSSAVGFLVGANDLARQAENCELLEAPLQPYGPRRELDPRDMLYAESLWPTGFGTCFLTKDSEVMTAAHVFCRDSGAWQALRDGTLRAVFGYAVETDGQVARVFRENLQVFAVKPQTVVCPPPGQSFPLADDWIKLALVEPATVGGRTPLLVSSDPPTINTPVYTLGHPNGVSLRYVRTSIQLETQAHGFSAFLDAYNRSSGSPVFSADDHSVVGLVKFSYQPGGRFAVLDSDGLHVSQLCLPDFVEKATLCVNSVAFGS